MHHSILRFAFTLLLVATPIACQPQNDSAPSSATDGQSAPAADIVATVNGIPITKGDLEQFRTQQKDKNLDDQALLEELINIRLLIQKAEAEGIPERPEFKAEMEEQRVRILVGTVLSEYMSGLNIDDGALKKEYEKQIAGMDNKEFKARHILVENEDEARAIIKQLDDGADFAKLAEEKSTGPSGPRGGDLGWFKASSMVGPFGDAVQTMKKGEVRAEPVKTQFGWHVILLEDTREIDPPSFDEVKDQINSILVNKALQQYVQELRQNADIKINEAGAAK